MTARLSRTLSRAIAAFCALAMTTLAGVPAYSGEVGQKDSGSQSALPGAGILVPREVFVGDSAELSFTTGAFNAALEPGADALVPPGDVAVSSDATVASVAAHRGASSTTVVIRFVPWTTGLLRLPPFTLKKIRVVPPPVRISSLAEKTGQTALDPPRSPLLVPGTTLVLYALCASAIAFLAFGAIAFARFRRYLSLNEGRIRSGRRTKVVMRELKYLERRIHRTESVEWYALFSAALRRYLGTLLSGNPSGFLSSTSREISEALLAVTRARASDDDNARVLTAAAIARADALLTGIDSTRFSGRAVADSRHADVAEARALVLALEDTVGAAKDAREAN
jgi:hypothetical protein